MNTVTTTVEIASPDGHDTLELTQDQTIALVDRGDNWVFANGQMMQPAQLADSDWATVGTVRIVPGLVGGLC
jgi:precorrin-3B methylase